MLFNSPVFLFVFLPLVLAGFFVLSRVARPLCSGYLVLASLFFYGWWDPATVLLLAASILFNYGAGVTLSRVQIGVRRTWLFVAAVGVNLLVLGFFKYSHFLFSIFCGGSVAPLWMQAALPLGISFYTFTQIAFLVDVHRGLVREYSLLHYCLFVTWFPHLIAGPVLHHSQMMPQFRDESVYRPQGSNIAAGVMLFAIGLFKKVVLADQLAVFANPVFRQAAAGQSPSFFEAWIGAFTYAFQLYFDFSGYSDMAIGVSLLFNIRLPFNFSSPYKAASIAEFWRRWHMSLSTFLKDYLYVPLGGNRKGPLRRYVNLLVTMLLGGLWHGAGWTFLVWGGLHGVFLVVNHLWRSVCSDLRFTQGRCWRGLAMVLTFLCVVAAWVVFRADSLKSAGRILAGMVGLNGFMVPQGVLSRLPWLSGPSWRAGNIFAMNLYSAKQCLFLLSVSFIIVWCLPSSQAFMGWEDSRDRNGLEGLKWRPSTVYGLLTGALLAAAVLGNQVQSQFLYYQF